MSDESDPYGERVRALFESCAHAGRVEGGLEASVDDQGVRVELTANVSDRTVENLRFRAWGCPHLLAAAEWFCSEFEGRGLAELERLRRPSKLCKLCLYHGRRWVVYLCLKMQCVRSGHAAASSPIRARTKTYTMAISLTESAANRVRNYLEARGSGIGLRLGVTKTGCSGYAYAINYAEERRG